MQERPTILIPIRVLEGETIPEGVPELLANAHVVLLGYHVVPDQTATDQARSQFEAQASRRLEDFTSMLEHAGATVESLCVFTHDGEQTIDRKSDDHDCLAVLIPNATRPIETVLVAVRGVVGIDRIARLVSGLFAATDVDITLYHVVEDGETDADAETLFTGITTSLEAAGLPAESIETQTDRDGKPQQLIAEAAADHDAVVMGESDPSVTTLLFGMRADQVAKQFLGPVLVVQHGSLDDEESDDESA